MERRGANTWLVAALAIAVGFLAALLLLGGDDNENSSATVSTTNATTTQAGSDTTTATATPGTSTTTTTATQQGTAPQSPEATVASCIALWNQPNNRGNQTFLANLVSQQPVRVHAGATSDVPARCLMTIIANDGKASVFPEGGGTTFPYAIAPGATDGSALPAAQKTSNALEEGDGTLKAR